MRAAVKKLKDIVSSKDIVPILQHFVHREGVLYASNGVLTAAAPCDTPAGLGRFAVRAAEFQQFLDRSSGELQITLVDGIVQVRAGKLKAKFQSYVLDDAFDQENHDVSVESYELPEDFTKRLAYVRPFVSDNMVKPFATCILFKEDQLFATSNVVIANGTSGVKVEKDFLLPYKVADYVCKHAEGLSTLDIYANRSCRFSWDDGGWLYSAGMNTEFPDVAPVIKGIGDPSWEITTDWRRALEETISLGDSEVNIDAEKFESKTDNGTVYEHEMETTFPEGLKCMQIMPKFVGQVFDNATHVDFVVRGGKVHINFKSENIKGVGLGLRLL